MLNKSIKDKKNCLIDTIFTYTWFHKRIIKQIPGIKKNKNIKKFLFIQKNPNNYQTPLHLLFRI